MFSRALLVALCIVYATSLNPLTAPADDDCALYLSGPGRSSAYDYSLNLLKGNFGYDGQHTCITYDAINQAYLDARTRILVSQPKGDWKAEDFASAGELLLDISISLARTYGLTYEEIEKGLPLIDTSRTLIREACPPVFSHVECRAGKYRRLDGLCNNLRHPTWGSTMAPFQRLIGPLFADGINAPRIAHTGRDLPLSRVVSRTMHPDDGFHDHAGTVMVIAWGQFMDHDYTLTGTPLDPIHRNDPEECCKRPLHLKHPYCNEIRVPDDDYFYRLFGVKCIDFVRGFPSPRPGCRLGSRIPFNTLTGAIDGNTVYGVTEKFSRKLRTGYGGLLRMNPVFKEYGLKDLLPLKLDIPDEGCTRPNKNMYCFEAGEIRVNEQLVLTVMHTLMAREHNRVAEALASVNPHWDDETLFQEARRINIAEIQHITYNEFLPILLGKDVMEKFGLVLEKESHWDGYDPEVNPDVIASFAAAAYRFGHSLLPTAVERWSKAHKFIASKRLSDLIRRPYDLYRAGVLDEYVMGLMNQVAQAMDDSITQEVTNHLFKKVGARFGMDLVSFNMQRGREFGLPGYMEFRKFCGLSGAESFQDLFGSMPNETINKYETIFEHPVDVDLWSGGVSERPLPGSMLGPTFACIIATQFSYSRRGDRFWFELPNQPSSFTPEQLVEIRKSRLARVICDNTDIIDTVQLYPMVLPDHELNPRVPCRSGIIPSMDFSKWAEPGPFVGGAKEYMTDAYICNATSSEQINNRILDNVTADKPVPENTEVIQPENCNYTDINVTPQNNFNTVNVILENANGAETDINEMKNETENFKNLHVNNKKHNTDTVLKYVYKKGDKMHIEKPKSHIKNSLKRKKRRVDDDSNEEYHMNREFEKKEREELDLVQHIPSGNIKSSNLAEFNIETLHENDNNNEKYSKERESKQYLPEVEKNTNDNIEIEGSEQNDNENLPYQETERTNNFKNDKNANFPHKNEDDLGLKQHANVNEKNRIYGNTERQENFKNERNLPDTNDDEFVRIQHAKVSDDSAEQYSPRQPHTNSDENKDEKKYHNLRHRLDERNFPEKNKDEFVPIQHAKVNDDSAEQYSPRQPHTKSDENKDEKKYYNIRNSLGERNFPEKNEEELVRIQHAKENDDSTEQYSLRQPHTKSDENKDEKKYYNIRNSLGERNFPEKNEEELVRIQHAKENDDSAEQYSPRQPHTITDENNDENKYYNIRNRLKERNFPEKNENEFVQIQHAKVSDDSAEQYLPRQLPIYSDENKDENKYYNIRNRLRKQRNRAAFRRFPKVIPVIPIITEDKMENEEINEKPSQVQSQGLVENSVVHENLNNSEAIQGVSLGDISYEIIKLNDKGQVETAKDLNINPRNDFSTSDALEKEPLAKIPNENPSNSEHIDEKNIDKPDNSNEYEKQVNINDGEVKPVVELNGEDSDEENEDDPKDVLTDKLRESAQKPIIPNSAQEIASPEIKTKEAKTNVKQEFERIPLNYNHVFTKSNSSQNEQDNRQNEESDGTLDAIAPSVEKFDENLNIKFSDISIKLPEIILPDDVLEYAKVEPVYENRDKDKNTYYHYDDGDESNEEESNIKKNNEDNSENEQDFYTSYFDTPIEKSQSPNTKQQVNNYDIHNENYEEDLYEKFVRERFGKDNSLKQKSEKLVDQRPKTNNPKLFEKIQTVLKKADEIQKEAEKSGDPDAGYLWTLEYGENL